MRLTLRTMLAYLDEILEPADAQDIGKKIEESEFATSLLHRTRDVTRRLRLGAPPLIGKGVALDPNTVAEYLDNTLASDRVPDFEKVCLESDVHLAEVAAAHQILALVLQEPVAVEPASRDRMYNLIHEPQEAAADKVASEQATRQPAAHETPPINKAASATAPTNGAAAGTRDTEAGAPPVSAAATPVTASPMAVVEPVRRTKPEVPDYLREPRSRMGQAIVAAALVAAVVIGGLVMLGPPSVKQYVASLWSPNSEQASGPQNNTQPVPGEPANKPGDGASEDKSGEPAGAPAKQPSDDENTPPSERPMPRPTEGDTPPVPTPGDTVPPRGEGTPPAGPRLPAPGENPGDKPPVPATEVGTVPGTPPLVGPAGVPVGPAGVPVGPAGVPAVGPAGLPVGPAPVGPGGVPAGPAVTGTGTPPAGAPLIGPKPVGPPTGDGLPVPPVPETAPPATAVGRFVTPQNVLLRFDRAENGWRRLPANANLLAGDRLLALPTYSPTLTLANGVSVQPIGPATIDLTALDEQGVPGVVIQHGRVLMMTPGKAGSLVRIQVGQRQGRAAFGGGDSTLAIEVRPMLSIGRDPEKEQAPLAAELYATSGEIVWTEGTEEVPMRAPQRRALSQIGIGETPEGELPKWIAGDAITELDKRASTGPSSIEQDLTPDRPVSLGLKELTESRRMEVRSLAIRCGAYIGQFDPFVSALNDLEQRAMTNAHIDTLRAALARSPEVAAQVRLTFQKQKGEVDGFELYRMLWGYTPDEFKAEAGKLVRYLDHDSLDFRVLSFWNLQNITGTSLSYRPWDVAAKRRPSVLKWKEKQLEGKLLPPAPGAPPAAPTPPATPPAAPAPPTGT